MDKDLSQYVTFQIMNERFGINVMRVREVMYMINITLIPQTLPFMKGVIDLRGEIVPLVDLRMRYNYTEKAYDDNTVIVIIEFTDHRIGLIADAVFDVITLNADDIQRPDHFTISIDKDSVQGIVKTDNTLVIILDPDRLFTSEEHEVISGENTVIVNLPDTETVNDTVSQIHK